MRGCWLFAVLMVALGSTSCDAVTTADGDARVPVPDLALALDAGPPKPPLRLGLDDGTCAELSDDAQGLSFEVLANGSVAPSGLASSAQTAAAEQILTRSTELVSRLISSSLWNSHTECVTKRDGYGESISVDAPNGCRAPDGSWFEGHLRLSSTLLKAHITARAFSMVPAPGHGLDLLQLDGTTAFEQSGYGTGGCWASGGLYARIEASDHTWRKLAGHWTIHYAKKKGGPLLGYSRNLSPEAGLDRPRLAPPRKATEIAATRPKDLCFRVEYFGSTPVSMVLSSPIAR